MCTKSKYAGLFLVAVVVCVVGIRMRAQQSTKYIPFTATVVRARFNGQNQKTSEETITKAIRSDGSTAVSVMRLFPDGKQYQQLMIVDIQGKRRTVIDSATESITTYTLSSKTIDMLIKQYVDCRTLAAETQLIEGYSAKHEVVRGAASSATQDRWVAPDLDCFPLKETSTRDANDPRSPHNETHTIAVVIGEPASSLFSIPGSYTERSPKQVLAEFAKRFPGTDVVPFSNGSDQGYLNSRPQ
jgi:hypothetical protein